MEGNLLKWTNYVKRWQNRYFYINDATLYYCKKKGDRIRGYLSLKQSEISPYKGNPQKLLIKSQNQSIILKADSIPIAKHWMNALISAQFNLRTPVRPATIPNTSNRGQIQQPTQFQIIQLYFNKLWMLKQQMNNWCLSPSQQTHFLQLASQFNQISQDTLNLLNQQKQKIEDQNKLKPQKRYSVNLNSSQIDSKGNQNQSQSGSFFDACQEIFQQEQKSVQPFRKSLPVLRNPKQKINIWKILKESIGKDFSRISVPVYFNEPLSFTQRIAQVFTYSQILLRASKCQDDLMRLALVTCYCISHYSNSIHRAQKPFNPLLGETFQLVKDGFALLSQQVSHHPPITAYHCQHPQFVAYGFSEVKTSFKGTHMRIQPVGDSHLVFPKYDDHYVWNKPQTSVHNIIIGTVYADHHGQFVVRNISTGDSAVVNFKKKGWFKKQTDNVEGYVQDTTGNIHYRLQGRWDSVIRIINNSGESFDGFTKRQNPQNYQMNYLFTDFTLQLNIPPSYYTRLPSTDSRFRPDLRALQNGNIELAQSEKRRLEAKQREARAERQKRKIQYQPRWFALENETWVYKGGYWENRDHLRDLPDIY